jgi:hypothetical protein
MLDYDDLEGLRLLLERAREQEGAPGWSELDRLVSWALARDRSRAHLELLLAHGAPSGPAEATLAVRRGRADLADLLGPADPPPADELVGALRLADRAAAQAVLDANPGLLERLARGDHDVLVYAAAKGNADSAALMLDLGFPIEIRSEEFNETPLHAACWYGRASIARLLLDRGADAGAVAGRPFGGTPLDWAVRGSRHAEHDVFGPGHEVDYPAVVGHLLAAGAALSSPDVAEEASDEVAPLLMTAAEAR